MIHPPRYHLAAACALGFAVAALAPSRPAQAQSLSDTKRMSVARKLQRSTVVVQASARAGGSGFVVGEEKWVVTNAHVVRSRQRDRVRVRFHGDERRAGRVVAYDPNHDLAVIDVRGEVDVPALELGDSDEVAVGQTVLAFGSPFGLEGTLTQGIVSARRDLPAIGGGHIEGLIQTDAPINPGNSGGPLVNAEGEVVGVNTAILSRTGGSQGIGFAVPANYVRKLLDKVRSAQQRSAQQAGKARRQRSSGDVWLGIFGDDFRSRGVAGVRVQRVVSNGPADEAGIMGAAESPPAFVRRLGVPWTGHIILALDGKPVRNMGMLRRRLRAHEPGDEVKLFITVGPGVVSGEATVELEPRPERFQQQGK